MGTAAMKMMRVAAMLVVVGGRLGTDQTEQVFWRSVLATYNGLKPRHAPPCKPDQIRKKWERIAKAF